MKTKLLIAAIILAKSFCFSQEKEIDNPPHKFMTIIKGNPFSILAGVIPLTSEYRLMAEFVVEKDQSTQIGFSYLGKSPFLSLLESANTLNNGLQQKFIVRGFRVQASRKYYFSQFDDKLDSSEDMAPNGFYISPHFSFSSAKIDMQYFQVYDIWIRATQFNASILIGGQGFLGNFTLDVFTGLGYKQNEWIERFSPTQILIIDPDDLALPRTYSGPIKFSLGFNIGYAF